MEVRSIVVERFSVISRKPFGEILACIDSAIGKHDPVMLERAIHATHSYSDLKFIVDKLTGPSELLEFLRLDIGAIVTKGRDGEKPRSLRLLVGNPLIMRQMAEHVPDVGSYAPVTLLIDERSDGVHLSYDRMASLLACYEDSAASECARSLDLKVEKLIVDAAAS